MSTRREELIEELKGIRNELHRSANDLDQLLRDLNYTLDLEPDDPEFNLALVSTKIKYREHLSEKRGWSTLSELEAKIWNELMGEL